MRLRQLSLRVALIVLGAACTDVRLWRPAELEPVSVDIERPTPVEPEQSWGFVAEPGTKLRYRVGEHFCTQPSHQVTVPFKLMLIIDYSGSMNTSDPQMLRITAIERFVNAYANNPNVYWNFLRFGGAPFPLASLGTDFTNNPLRVQAALTELRAANTVQDGSTNYQDSLAWAWDTIDEDQSREGAIPGTRYGILFVTDGRPNTPEGGNPDQALAANRPKVRDRITGCDGYKAHKPLNTMIEFLNTYFINVGGPDPLAAGLLRDMAEGTSLDACGPDNWGHGSYTEVQNAGDLEFEVDLPELRKVFVNRAGFVFFNYHLRAAFKTDSMVMARDSDGDGLPDFVESEQPDPNDPWATSSYTWDTDGDGISDLVGWALGMQTNNPQPVTIYDRPPVDPDLARRGILLPLGPIVPTEHDDDADGLTDDEENFLGTDKNLIDTDKDGLTDYVELRYQMNPLDPTDAALDGDGDGFDSKAEIEMGMDPHHAEPSWFRDAFAYQLRRGREFIVEVPNSGDPPQVRTCYEFGIDNVLFKKPLTAASSFDDINLFELSFIDQTRLPIGQLEFVSRRQTMLARPADDRPNFEFSRAFPSHW